jgi:hypothetical protein
MRWCLCAGDRSFYTDLKKCDHDIAFYPDRGTTLRLITEKGSRKSTIPVRIPAQQPGPYC